MLFFIILLIFIYPAFILMGSFYYPMDVNEIIYLIMRYCGLVSYLALFFQYILSSKIKFLEKFVPLDVRIKKHRSLGYIAFFTVFLHPQFYFFYIFRNSIPFMADPFSLLGSLSSFIIYTITFTSIFNKKLKLKYETWKKIHWLSFLVLTFIYFHAINLGSDMYGVHKNVFTILWFINLIIVLYKISFEIYKVINTFTVSEVTKENESVTTIRVKTKRLFKPGQFGFINILKNDKWLSWHPFTISAPGNSGFVSFTIKNLGDFTSNIKDVKPGDKIKLDYPYGGFTTENSEQRLIFIAGGVGITPFHSIISSLSNIDSDKDLTLLYAVNRENELIFRKELEEIFEKRPNWNLKLIVSMEESWDGIKGFITPNRLKVLCDNSLEGTFYLCGPKVMVSPLKVYLKSNNVSRKNIRAEEFLFLP